MIRRWGAVLTLSLIALAASAGVPKPGAIAGFWRTAQGGAVIHITEHRGDFPARIVWLRQSHYPADDPLGMAGRAIVDRHNPDPAKRDRPLIGLRMIKDLDYHVLNNDQARWENGRVYDADKGKWYRCYIWLADRDHLKLHGYLGVAVLGRTTTWTRVSDPRAADDADAGNDPQDRS